MQQATKPLSTMEPDVSHTNTPPATPRRLRGTIGAISTEALIGIILVVMFLGIGGVAFLPILTGGQEDTAAIEFQQVVGAAEQLMQQQTLRGSEYYELVGTAREACVNDWETDNVSNEGTCQTDNHDDLEGLPTKVAELIASRFEGGREIVPMGVFTSSAGTSTATTIIEPDEIMVDVQVVNYTPSDSYALSAADTIDRGVAGGVNGRHVGDSIRLAIQPTDDMLLCAIITQRKGNEAINGTWYVAYEGFSSYLVQHLDGKTDGETMCKWGAMDHLTAELDEDEIMSAGWERDPYTAMANPVIRVTTTANPDSGNPGCAGTSTTDDGDDGPATGGAEDAACSGAWTFSS